MRERKVRRGGKVYQMAVPEAKAEPVQEKALPAVQSILAKVSSCPRPAARVQHTVGDRLVWVNFRPVDLRVIASLPVSP